MIPDSVTLETGINPFIIMQDSYAMVTGIQISLTGNQRYHYKEHMMTQPERRREKETDGEKENPTPSHTNIQFTSVNE